eukprot:scaffold7359_cov255-Pinguiococcus_pyrenoidosus.AAC.13
MCNDLRFVDRDDRVHEVPDDRPGMRPEQGLEPVRNRRGLPRQMILHLVRLLRQKRVLGVLRLGRHNLDAGLDRLGCDGHPAGQATAPNGHDKAVQLRNLLQQFQRQRPLARDDVRVVARVHKVPAHRRAHTLSLGRASLVGRRAERDLGAVSPDRGDLDIRRRLRHDNVRAAAGQLRRQCQRLRVVAATMGD